MAIRLREPHDSRELQFGANGGSQTFKLVAICTANEQETAVYSYVLANSLPYSNGFIRNDMNVRPTTTGRRYEVELKYATSGVGGGDQPLGGAGGDGGPLPSPSAPGADSTPLASGYSFQVNAPRLHLTQSRSTSLSVKRGGGDAPNFMRRIGVDKDGNAQGVDFPPDAAITFTRTWARANVTMGYIRALAELAGHPNNAPFYQNAAGEVMLMSASGTYSQGEGWSMTANFGISPDASDIEICTGLTVFFKSGWDYLWIFDERIQDPVSGKMVTVPGAAYVERVLDRVDFSIIGIGA